MRRLLNTLLVTLILACPVLCGAAEIGHSTEQGHGSLAAGDEGAPAHCPESSDDCVCRGALQTVEARAMMPDLFASGLLSFDAAQYPALQLTLGLPRDHEPSGLSCRGDALTVRALLQNFRF